MMINRALAFLLIFVFLLPAPAAAETAPKPYLVKDINTHTSESSSIYHPMNYQGFLYFFASMPGKLMGLWKSDGTTEHTLLVKPGFTYPCWDSIVYHDILYFCAVHDVYGGGLWRTDGTPAGTFRLELPAPWQMSFTPGFYTVMQDELYFIALSALWKTDGVHIERLTPSAVMVSSHSPVELNGQLYFNANDTQRGEELWRTDGTPQGTQLFQNLLQPDPKGSSPVLLLSHQGWLYFTIDESSLGDYATARMLWVTDGDPAHTQLYTDEVVFSYSDTSQAAEYGGGLLLAASTTMYGTELWWTPGMSLDGTPQTVSLVSDFVPGQRSSDPILLGELNGQFLFVADKLPFEEEHFYAPDERIWRLGQPDQPPQPVADVALGSKYYGALMQEQFRWLRYQDRLYFEAYDNQHGWELWRTDGTGTQMAFEVNPGNYSGGAGVFGLCGGVFCFAANNGQHGLELWRSDGTEAHMVYDLNTTPVGAFPTELTPAGELLYFRADDGAHGPELWRSDGTPAGTFLVKDINLIEQNSFVVNSLTPVGSLLYFAAFSLESGAELWASDGQPGSAWLAADLEPGNTSSYPMSLTPAGDRLFLVDEDTNNYSHVYVLEPGQDVRQALDLYEFPYTHQSVDAMIGLGRDVLMMVTSFDTGRPRYEVLRNSGSPESTQVLINGLNISMKFDVFLPVGNEVYIIGQDQDYNPGLWRTDGTISGTVRITLPVARPSSDFLSVGTANGQVFYFMLDESFKYLQLYRIRPGANNAELVKQFLSSDWMLPYPMQGAAYGDRYVFSLQRRYEASVLFVSDGTEAGTYPVPGDPGDFNWLTAAGPFLYFTKTNTPNQAGKEIMVWDGSERAPRLLADINPGSSSSNPHELRVVGDTLFFSANDGIHGDELWAYSIPIKKLMLPFVSK